MTITAPSKAIDFRAEAIRRRGADALLLITTTIQADKYDQQTNTLLRFLLALHDPTRYRFTLTDLRDLEPHMVDACVAYLALDALDEEGVHHRIDGGEKTLDRWLQDFGPALPVRPEVDPAKPWPAKLVGTDSDWGLRDVQAMFDVTDHDGADRRIQLHLDPDSADRLRAHIVKVNLNAWRDEGPKDRVPGERAPRWVLDASRE
jgi:hypothetical protein